MNDQTDSVWLRVVFTGTSTRLGPMTLAQAGEMIESWSSGSWSRLGKVAGSAESRDGASSVRWALSVGDIAAMSVEEIEVDSTKEMLETHKRMVDLMEKQRRGELPGDEWKNDDIEEV